MRNEMEYSYYTRLGFMPKIKQVFKAPPVDIWQTGKKVKKDLNYSNTNT